VSELATVPVTLLPGMSALYRDYVNLADSPLQARLGGFRFGSEAWKRALASTPALDAALVDRLVAENESLGARKEVLERARGLADGSVRAVVTGQQPGVAGGPLLSLYKAATAIALARAIEKRAGVRCVPIFWLGSDDDDFAEIRELNLMSSSLELVSVSLDAPVHAPGRRVGDIAGTAVARAWDAVAPFVAPSDTVDEVRAWMNEGDLGRIAARALVAMTYGNLLVIDGREPRLREAGRATLLEFFDREDEVRARVRAQSDALVAEGYHAQIEMGSDSGLFLTVNGVRRRIPGEARAAARAALEHDITAASPGVVARTVLQDAVLHPAAVVLGPAEIAYRAQLTSVFDLLHIAAPVVFPRLAATFAPPAVLDAIRQCGVSADQLATDPAAWAVSTTEALMRDDVAQEAKSFEERFRQIAGNFLDVATTRLDDRATEKLERRIDDVAQRVHAVAQGAIEQDALAGAAKWPWLAQAAQLFARDGEPQERFLSALVPYTFHGAQAWQLIDEESAAHVASALDGAVTHRVYSR